MTLNELKVAKYEVFIEELDREIRAKAKWSEDQPTWQEVREFYLAIRNEHLIVDLTLLPESDDQTHL